MIQKVSSFRSSSGGFLNPFHVPSASNWTFFHALNLLSKLTTTLSTQDTAYQIFLLSLFRGFFWKKYKESMGGEVRVTRHPVHLSFMYQSLGCKIEIHQLHKKLTLIPYMLLLG